MPLVLINGAGAQRGMPTSLPSQRFGRVARGTGRRPKGAAGRKSTRKESQMPSFSIVRRRKRRRNMAGAVMRSGRNGRFVASGGTVQASFSPWSAKPKKKRRKKAKGSKKASAAPKKRKGRKKAAKGAVKRKKNPFRMNRRRRRRNSGLYLTNRRRRRRSHARRNPPRRRRNRRHARRRRNPFGLRRRRRHNRARRRRNPFGFRRRRNPGWGIMSNVRDIFSVSKGKDVLAGTFGLSASLWGPKLLGHLVWAPLGRGYGGVATSVVSSIVASKIAGYVSPTRARVTLVAGLLGSFAGLLSAIHCGWRTTVLPFETGLLACAMPTVPKPAAIPGSPAALALAGGMPLAQVKAAGLPGLSGYGGGVSANMNALLANEQAFRSNAGGLNDYVQVPGMRDYAAQISAGQRGMRDYAEFSGGGSSASMDASPESF